MSPHFPVVLDDRGYRLSLIGRTSRRPVLPTGRASGPTGLLALPATAGPFIVGWAQRAGDPLWRFGRSASVELRHRGRGRPADERLGLSERSAHDGCDTAASQEPCTGIISSHGVGSNSSGHSASSAGSNNHHRLDERRSRLIALGSMDGS